MEWCCRLVGAKDSDVVAGVSRRVSLEEVLAYTCRPRFDEGTVIRPETRLFDCKLPVRSFMH